MARKTKEMSPDKKRQVVRLHQEGFKKTEIGKIIGFSRSAVSKIVKRFEQRENIENKPRTGRPRVTRKQGEHTLIRPNKKICVFSIKCQKNLEWVGIIFLLFFFKNYRQSRNSRSLPRNPIFHFQNFR